EKDKMPAISNYYQDEDFLVFSQNVYDYLGFTYSFNKNFKNDIVDYCENELTFHTQMTIDDIELTYNLGSCQIGLDNTDAYGLNDGEVVMSYTKYNQIFKTTYDIKNLNTFVPHKIVVKQFKHSDSKMEEPELVKELYIKKLVSSTTTFYCKEDLFKEFNELSIFEKGLYYNQNDKVTSIINYANNNSFKYNSFIADGIHTMTKAVDVFIPIFRMIAIVLCTAIVFILINFSTKMINDKLHDIGILKALGTQNRSIAIVFGIQIILIAILTIVMSTLGYFIFIDLANDVLIASLKELAESHVVLDLDFLTFKTDVVVINVILILILVIISLVAPMIKIKNIRPVKILKTKE
ncbi:MAG: FtsX-like permease family protein, partial [Acholeplasmatales bacterium]|nr:FtsX-like permease family protein [Acholeplasmatales bacterium]